MFGRKRRARDHELEKARRAVKVSEKTLERVTSQTVEVLELGERLAERARTNHYSEKIDAIYGG